MFCFLPLFLLSFLLFPVFFSLFSFLFFFYLPVSIKIAFRADFEKKRLYRLLLKRVSFYLSIVSRVHSYIVHTTTRIIISYFLFSSICFLPKKKKTSVHFQKFPFVSFFFIYSCSLQIIDIHIFLAVWCIETFCFSF